MKVKKQKSLPYLCLMLQDTICALATASGVGAISVIRLSGPEAISICNKVFPAKNLSNNYHTQFTLERFVMMIKLLMKYW